MMKLKIQRFKIQDSAVVSNRDRLPCKTKPALLAGAVLLWLAQTSEQTGKRCCCKSASCHCDWVLTLDTDTG